MKIQCLRWQDTDETMMKLFYIPFSLSLMSAWCGHWSGRGCRSRCRRSRCCRRFGLKITKSQRHFTFRLNEFTKNTNQKETSQAPLPYTFLWIISNWLKTKTQWSIQRPNSRPFALCQEKLFARANGNLVVEPKERTGPNTKTAFNERAESKSGKQSTNTPIIENVIFDNILWYSTSLPRDANSE